MKARLRSPLVLGLMSATLGFSSLRAADWPQFRGPNGSGIADGANPPLKWSDTENLQWKAELPGPGTSSPIVVGERVFVTCWSGFGQGKQIGNNQLLNRFLVCLERRTGTILWSKRVAGETNPDPYEGFLQEHGYASHTPVSDGEHVYVYFGKRGALAFDLDGNQLWLSRLGTSANAKNWGSASSPLLYQNSIIINASEESHAIYALDKQTGKQIWKSEAASLAYVFGTPALVRNGEATELIVSVPDEIWGLNPQTGKTRWYAHTGLSGNIVPSVVHGAGAVFAFGGFPALGAVSIKLGGHGDVTKTHALWSGKTGGTYVPTPVFHKGCLYFASDSGFATCLEAATGKLVFKERIPGANASGTGGKPFYASAILANDHVYSVSRWNGVFVFAANPEFKLVAQNKFASDLTQFNATPAIADDQIFLRSDRYLYCAASGAGGGGQ